MSKLWRTAKAAAQASHRTRRGRERLMEFDPWRAALPYLLALGLLAGATSANAGHSLSDIAGTAAMAMQSQANEAGYRDVEVQLRPLDARLNLAECERPLETLPANSARPLGAVSIGVRCNGESPWTLYVRGQVSANQQAPVLVASVGRGERIGSADVSYENRQISNDIVGIVTDIDDIIGKEARRSLRAGEPVKFSDLRSPQLIERGQTVTLVSGMAGLQVSMQGKALAGGAQGDRLMVSNLSSGKRVEGVVMADGAVRID